MFNHKKKTISKQVAFVVFSMGLSAASFANSGEGPSHLTDEEKLLIEQKKDAILFLLEENDQLQPYLDALKNQDIEKAKRDELTEKYPYSKDEIIQRRLLDQDIEQAKNTPISPKEIKITEESFDPNARLPIVLNVAANNPSSLSFFDYQGNPWPIAGDVIGDTTSFTSNVFTDNKNVVVFSILNRFAESVALVNLEGLNNLVVVKLSGNENIIDSDKRIRLPLASPLVEKDIVAVNDKPMATDRSSDRIFDALVSGNYKKLGTELFVRNNPDRNNVFVEVDDLVYMRVKHTLVHPIPLTYHRSSNGFNLYKMEAKDTVTLNVNGEYKIYTLEKESF